MRFWRRREEAETDDAVAEEAESLLDARILATIPQLKNKRGAYSRSASGVAK